MARDTTITCMERNDWLCIFIICQTLASKPDIWRVKGSAEAVRVWNDLIQSLSQALYQVRLGDED